MGPIIATPVVMIVSLFSGSLTLLSSGIDRRNTVCDDHPLYALDPCTVNDPCWGVLSLLIVSEALNIRVSVLAGHIDDLDSCAGGDRPEIVRGRSPTSLFLDSCAEYHLRASAPADPLLRSVDRILI